ncbi:MAG: GNAT family N-acetyltransferase [Promethearchaeota archaeon]
MRILNVKDKLFFYMTLEFKIRELSESDKHAVLSIYNYHVINGFAAYSDKELKIEFINRLKKDSISFIILEIENKIVGFAVLRNYLPYENFKHTGQLSYFIKPEYTNKGFGTILLNKLVKSAIAKGINIFIVHLTSLNEQSLNFHKKHGFIECGRLTDIAMKFNRSFDIIFMQKVINS